MAEYRPFVGIQVEHEFTAPAPCDALVFEPDDGTRALLGRAGILFRDERDGFQSYYDADEDGLLRSWLSDPEQPFRMTFRIRVRDPEFHRYTDIPEVDETPVRILDTSVEGPEGTTLRLFSGPGGAARVLPEAAAEPGLVTRRDRLAPPLAILLIQIGAELLDAQRVEPFRLAFAARRTVWRYHLLGDFADREVAIRDQAPEDPEAIRFEPAEMVSLPGGRPARMLVSDAPIAILQRTPRRLQLREEGPGRSRILVRRLPVAAPEHLSIATVDGRRTLVSDIYVNS